jgi:hypothetical protein
MSGQTLDEDLDALLRAAGSRLAHYTPETQKKLRDTLRAMFIREYANGVRCEQVARAVFDKMAAK